MLCPNCQHENRESAKFCENCSTKLERTCPNCGTQNRPDAKFCDTCGTRLTSTKEKPVGETRSPATDYIPEEYALKLNKARTAGAMVGERRIVTMLFCDVKGSTAAAEQLDPEDWAEIMNGVFEYMIRPVYKYEGTVARLMGDAILAFFGAPIAHEDDPQRAILAGLEIANGFGPYQQQVQEAWNVEIDVRVGLNTGLVMVGAVGSDLQMEYTALGDAINLAARMEQTAQPGTVQVSEHTYKLVTPLFEWESLGEIQVKGKTDPIQTYRPLRQKSSPARLRGIEGLETPLIGRDAEFEQLHAALEKLRDKKSGILFIIGEAGLGKSRLIREARIRAESSEADPALKWFERNATSYETSQAYGMAKALLRQMLGFEESAPSEQVQERLREWGESSLPADKREQDVASLIRLFGSGDQKGEAARLEGEAFQRRLFAGMRSFFQSQFESIPTVIVLDDLHWADAASAELVKHLFQLTDQLPILFLCATRPDRKASGWELHTAVERDYPHRLTEINLTPLSAEDGDSLVDSLLTVSDLPEALRKTISNRAEGNPFFVEEIVRTLIDENIVTQHGDHWEVARQVDDLDIPDNVQALLAARMDRLEAEAREVLQLASVIGRSFYYRVLRQVCGTEIALEQKLSVLQRVQMILEAARVPELEYAFRHALTQETAYRSILRRQRRKFHREVGEAIEELFSENLDEYAPVLAYHFELAEEDERALRYHNLAGDGAFDLFATAEAIEHYTRAFKIARRTADSSAALAPQDMEHIAIRLGRSYELASGFDDALSHYETVEEWGESQDDPHLALTGLLNQAVLRSTATKLYDAELAAPLLERALASAQALKDEKSESKALWVKMNLLRLQSDNDGARQAGEASLALAEKHDLRERKAYALHDLGYVYDELGEVEKAARAYESAEALWRKLNNLPMVADGLSARVPNKYIFGKFDEAIAAADEAHRISQSIENLWGEAFSLMMIGFVYRDLGETARALESAETSMRVGAQAGFGMTTAFASPQIALVLSDLGLPARGLERAREVQDQVTGPMRPFNSLVQAYCLAKMGKLDRSQENMLPFNEMYPAPLENFAYLVYASTTYLDIALQRDPPKDTLPMIVAHIEKYEQYGLTTLLAEAYHLHAKALRMLERTDEASASLNKARKIATGINHRRILWQALAQAAEIERERGDFESAKTLWREAREIVIYICEHAPEKLRESFVSQPGVHRVLSPPEG
jgi:predicted ATPase/class 3 adenylate cyclase